MLTKVSAYWYNVAANYYAIFIYTA